MYKYAALVCIPALAAALLEAQDPVAGWKRVKLFKDGNAILSFVDVDRAWRELQLKWICPCDADRTMLLTARGTEKGAPPLGRKRVDIDLEGDTTFSIPDGTASVTLSMYGKHCHAAMELEVLAPISPARPATDPDFRSTRWGMSKAQVIAGEGAPVSDTPGRLLYNVDLAGLKAALHFNFDAGRLASAEYDLVETYAEPSQYVVNSAIWLDSLGIKYGEPKRQIRWLDNLYKDVPAQYALAVASGHVEVKNVWQTDRTRIEHRLSGRNGVISVSIVYTGNQFAPR